MPLNLSLERPASASASDRALQPASLLKTLVLASAWFGLAAGLVEGSALLVFQRLNWRRWGPMVHVSKEILWISPIVDLLLFVALAFLVALCARFSHRLPAMQVLLFLLTFLSIYDWIALTERIYHFACALLAIGVAVAVNRHLRHQEPRYLQLWRRSTPVLVVGVLLLALGMKAGEWLVERHQLAAAPLAAPGSPNILLIVIDTLRADHVSSYGYSRSTTPNIDRIAREGVVFENAIAPCSWTLPSHASLLTGRYPSDHGMQNAQPMPWFGWGPSGLRGYVTLGEALQAHGYRSGAFSANQTYFTSNVGLGRGFVHFEDYFQSPRDMFLRTFYGREFARVYLNRTEHSEITRAIRFLGLGSLLDNRKRADEVNREALSWISGDRSRPFFAFLNYIDVHDAYWLARTRVTAAWAGGTRIDQYDNALSYVDTYVGELVRDLERRQLAKDLLVIITSDHGETLGQHHLEFHGVTLYREELRVPLVFWYPGHIPAGLRKELPVSMASIPGTIMELLGDHRQNTFPQRGLSPLWTRGQMISDWPKPVSELAQNDIVSKEDRAAGRIEPTAIDGDMVSVVTSNWHFIRHSKFGDQLYRWRDDLGESSNRIDTAEGRAVTPELTYELDQELKSSPSH
jgi:arylsulfatase A-like enzyme